MKKKKLLIYPSLGLLGLLGSVSILPITLTSCSIFDTTIDLPNDFLTLINNFIIANSIDNANQFNNNVDKLYNSLNSSGIFNNKKVDISANESTITFNADIGLTFNGSNIINNDSNETIIINSSDNVLTIENIDWYNPVVVTLNDTYVSNFVNNFIDNNGIYSCEDFNTKYTETFINQFKTFLGNNNINNINDLSVNATNNEINITSNNGKVKFVLNNSSSSDSTTNESSQTQTQTQTSNNRNLDVEIAGINSNSLIIGNIKWLSDYFFVDNQTLVNLKDNLFNIGFTLPNTISNSVNLLNTSVANTILSSIQSNFTSSEVSSINASFSTTNVTDQANSANQYNLINLSITLNSDSIYRFRNKISSSKSTTSTSYNISEDGLILTINNLEINKPITIDNNIHNIVNNWFQANKINDDYSSSTIQNISGFWNLFTDNMTYDSSFNAQNILVATISNNNIKIQINNPTTNHYRFCSVNLGANASINENATVLNVGFNYYVNNDTTFNITNINTSTINNVLSQLNIYDPSMVQANKANILKRVFSDNSFPVNKVNIITGTKQTNNTTVNTIKFQSNSNISFINDNLPEFLPPLTEFTIDNIVYPALNINVNIPNLTANLNNFIINNLIFDENSFNNYKSAVLSTLFGNNLTLNECTLTIANNNNTTGQDNQLNRTTNNQQLTITINSDVNKNFITTNSTNSNTTNNKSITIPFSYNTQLSLNNNYNSLLNESFFTTNGINQINYNFDKKQKIIETVVSEFNNMSDEEKSTIVENIVLSYNQSNSSLNISIKNTAPYVFISSNNTIATKSIILQNINIPAQSSSSTKYINKMTLNTNSKANLNSKHNFYAKFIK